jgi:hypothetical protein
MREKIVAAAGCDGGCEPHLHLRKILQSQKNFVSSKNSQSQKNFAKSEKFCKASKKREG